MRLALPHRVYDDRRAAGSALARALAPWHDQGAVVIGLARGGVEVAAAVAQHLRLPLDALAVRKIGHPFQPEFALGAVAPDGVVYLRDERGIDPDALSEAVAAARERVAILDARLHARHVPLDPAGRMCILVDDGLATGATMVAAVRWAREHAAAGVCVAVPVASPEGVDLIAREADAVVCPLVPPRFEAVGRWYRNFDQVDDDTVIALIAAYRPD